MVSVDVLHRATVLCLIVGLAFSVYSMVESVDTSLESTCNVNTWVQCGAVDSSAYSHIGPIPDYAIGIGGFLAMLGVEGMLLRTYDPRYLRALLGLSVLGVVVSIGFGMTELFLVDPSHPVFCPICLGAYLSNVGVLVSVLAMVRMRRSPISTDEEDEDESAPRKARGGNNDDEGSSGNRSKGRKRPKKAAVED